jgi:protein gp37
MEPTGKFRTHRGQRQLQMKHGGIHWVIGGGESGPGARPMHPDWARSLRDQCQAARVPFSFKQWGEWAPGSWAGIHSRKDVRTLGTNGREMPWNAAGSGGMWSPVRMRRVGKKAAGRLLDGREHMEFPSGH